MGVGDREVEGDGADAGEEVGHVCCEAGNVEEGCYGSCGDGDGGAVAEVAGVVLRTATDGDVAESEACCWGWEGNGCWVEMLVAVGDGDVHRLDVVNVVLTGWHDCVLEVA